MTIANAGAQWREPRTEAVGTSRRYLVRDGADWIYSATGPAEAEWIDVLDNGVSVLTDVTTATLGMTLGHATIAAPGTGSGPLPPPAAPNVPPANHRVALGDSAGNIIIY